MIKKRQTNKTTIICMVILISLLSAISPLRTYCKTNEMVQISEDLNETIIEQLDNIDFSGFNEVILEFQNSGTNGIMQHRLMSRGEYYDYIACQNIY